MTPLKGMDTRTRGLGHSSTAHLDLSSRRQGGNYHFDASEIARVRVGTSLQPSYNRDANICHFGKISHFIRPALERGYGNHVVRTPFSMPDSG